MNIKENLELIRNTIAISENASGRQAGSVKLLAVSKFHPVEEIKKAISANQMLFGENRVQEAMTKFPPLQEQYPQIKLHLIGQLQTNKVKNAVKIADYIQSVDRLELLAEIEKQCEKINKTINILFEYHTAEDSKSGFASEKELFEVMDKMAENTFSHIIPCGFMTMAPFTDDEKLIRKSFITLRNIQEKSKSNYPQFNLNELSMGMSNDYKIAIEEGSTIVRVGTAIFGERDYSKK